MFLAGHAPHWQLRPQRAHDEQAGDGARCGSGSNSSCGSGAPGWLRLLLLLLLLLLAFGAAAATFWRCAGHVPPASARQRVPGQVGGRPATCEGAASLTGRTGAAAAVQLHIAPEERPSSAVWGLLPAQPGRVWSSVDCFETTRYPSVPCQALASTDRGVASIAGWHSRSAADRAKLPLCSRTPLFTIVAQYRQEIEHFLAFERPCCRSDLLPDEPHSSHLRCHSGWQAAGGRV